MNGELSRRIQAILALFVAAALVISAGVYVGYWAGPASRGAPIVDHGKWAPTSRAAVERLIARNGVKSPAYDARRRPYVVFDWDNTAIMHDTEEALFTYQIDNLAFKLTPAEFARVITKDVPPGPFAAAYKNAAGQVVTLEAIAADLNRDYLYLYANYKGFAGHMTLEQIRATEQFKDFKVKLLFLYEAVNETHGTKVGYPWVLYFFTNMTLQEVRQLAEASNDYNLGAAISKVSLTSPAALAGAAGVVSSSYVTGLRLTPEIADLMHTFEANGIDVYVVTASLEEVVRVFATLPKYGYGVKPANVIGMRLEEKNGLVQLNYRAGWPVTVGHGKTEAITREIARHREGRGPIFVAGDSSGDFEMMTEFRDTQLLLVVNRLKGGNIGKLAERAAAEAGKPNPTVVMQGRNENTGMWIPTESTIKLGKSEARLLP